MSKKPSPHDNDQSMDALFLPIKPLREKALTQLGGHEDNFYEWAVLAAATHYLRPEVALEKLLPDQLDDVIYELGPDFQDELADFIDDENDDEEE